MTRIAFASATIAAALLAGTTVASTQEVSQTVAQPAMCGKRTDIVKELARQYREAPTALGQLGPQTVLEIFVSDTGTFTILATKTDGSSCIVSAGEGWQSKVLVAGRDA